MARPVLTGVNFLVENDQILMVSTDGFRLSLLKIKKEIDIPSFIVPASFLEEILNFIKKEKEVKFFYSTEEKMIKFQINDLEFYSRLIEGDFPPFEKVIPQKALITVEVEKDEFLRNIKLVAIFAREYSNVVILKIKKDKIIFQPKADSEEKEIAIQEAKIIGEEEIKVAFNYKFLLDLLNHLQGKDLLIELVRKDAPVVFKIKNNPDFLHIIMPVRTQE
jgi:DNA polymerase-3 subunit beta